jgi:hypothetical protein
MEPKGNWRTFMELRTITTAASAVSLSLILSACATPRAAHDDHANMDAQAMCEMHKKMMGSMSAEKQQAMMAEHMKDMSADMRARMQEMHARCR